LTNLLSGYRKFALQNIEEFEKELPRDKPNNLALGVIGTIYLIMAVLIITANLIDYYGPVVTVGGLTIAVATVRRRGGCFLGWLAAAVAIGGLAYVLPWTNQVSLKKIFGLTTSIAAVMLASPGSFGPINRRGRRMARRIKNAAAERLALNFAVGAAVRANQRVDVTRLDLPALPLNLGKDIINGANGIRPYG
jgi:hypothetical protein